MHHRALQNTENSAGRTLPDATSAQTQALTCAEDYFVKVLKPNHETFFGVSSTFASAFNFASPLYHFHEWLFDEFKVKLESEFNTTFSTKGKFWQDVEQKNKKFGYIVTIIPTEPKVFPLPRHKPSYLS
jgi:hypothetical protein